MIPAELLKLKPLMAAAAQQVYEDWDLDTLGCGGICDQVAEAIGGVIVGNIADCDVDDGGWEGDDHAWLIATLGQKRFGVDIHHGLYESGSGYVWQKKPGVTLKADDVSIWPID